MTQPCLAPACTDSGSVVGLLPKITTFTAHYADIRWSKILTAANPKGDTPHPSRLTRSKACEESKTQCIVVGAVPVFLLEVALGEYEVWGGADQPLVGGISVSDSFGSRQTTSITTIRCSSFLKDNHS